jgi:Tfp pilus assembly protein PilX
VGGEPSIKPAMPAFDRLRNRLRLLARSERGMALPTAIFAMVASLGMASVAVISSVDSQRGTARDNDSKSAIAAADAGANVALLRLNRYAGALSTSTSSNCLGVSGSTLTVTGAAGDGWCPAITGTVGDATFSYRVSPVVAAGTLTVISTGTAGAVGRRIAISFRTATVGSAFSREGLIGLDDIEIDERADVRVGVGTNGDIHVHNNGNVCGNVRHGIGREATFDNNGTQCSGYSIVEGNVNLPPVSSFIPTNIATSNSNARLAKCSLPGTPRDCQLDAYADTHGRSYPESPLSSSRALTVDNGATLTLTGGDYFICSLFLDNNAHLYIGSGAHVRIFFDTPENCGLTAGAHQIHVDNNADITATGYQSDRGQFDVPGFYLLGSPNIQTYAYWSNNAGGAEMVLYGPNTDIEFRNNATFVSAVAGKTVHMNNNAIVEALASQAIPQLGGATIFARQSYVECTGAIASPPNANC